MARMCCLIAGLGLAVCMGCGGKTETPAAKPAGGGEAAAPRDAKGTDKSGVTSELGPKGTGWGVLKGQIVFDGPRPEAKPLTINKDQEVCGKHGLVDESLLVSESGGIAGAVVSLRTAGGLKVPVHPDLEKAAAATLTVDNKNCRFEPHVTLVWVEKQELLFLNSDPVAHNYNLSPLKNEARNELLSPMQKSSPYKFTTAETVPVHVACNIHPWMRGFVVARDNPYMAVTDAEGRFEIKNIPAGTWTFQFWQEKPGYMSVTGADKQGRVTLEIKDGATNDLGRLAIPAAAFSGA